MTLMPLFKQTPPLRHNISGEVQTQGSDRHAPCLPSPLSTVERTPLSAPPAPLAVTSYRRAEDLPAEVVTFMSTICSDQLSGHASWYQNLCVGVPPLGQQAHFFVLFDAVAPLAVLPLATAEPMQRRLSLGARRVQALSNYYTALYQPVLAPRITVDDLLILLRYAMQALNSPSQLRLSPMDVDSRDYLLLGRALRQMYWATFGFFCFGNWHLKGLTDYDSYLKSRSGNLRSSLKRAVRKFETEGGTIEVITQPDRLQAGTDAYKAVYAESWKQDEPYAEFVPGLIALACREQWLRLGIAWLAGKPIAAQLWMRVGRRVEIYKVAYDEAYKAHSPGAVLTAALIRHSIENDKAEEIDFLIGDDTYKSSWMSHRRERWGLIAYNPRTFDGLVGMAVEFAGRWLTAASSRLAFLQSNRAKRTSMGDKSKR